MWLTLAAVWYSITGAPTGMGSPVEGCRWFSSPLVLELALQPYSCSIV